ncbi:hypothetical protein BLA9940_06139 [Burkholderia aenigmatica]|uniref:Uncharacterized protein n=1 Tax=Burkholderia aenigmatica TaxID=2015348 RepID=A0A6J5IT78_9BURK|nr:MULTISPECIES: hypothetical protein [Burkholderia]CAB3962877.1 hypothetical protein BLA3211_01947 [Burkholderia aenigmatica]VWD00857.1 hypothetical protein BLA9940_06139 [Burkholderia aenigmatica]
MSKKIFPPIILAISLFFSKESESREVSESGQSEYRYDLIKSCGFSLRSTRELRESQDACRLLYDDRSGSPFFYGSIAANPALLHEKVKIGFIDLNHGQPKTSRANYYDTQRDVTQEVTTSKKIPSPRGNRADIVIVSRLVLSYDKALENDRALVPVRELYECWDGFFPGTTTAVSLSLCSILPPRARSFASKSSWPAHVINSLVVE